MLLPSIDWDSVAWNLKDHLAQEGFSVRDAQKATGVDKAVISRVCNGAHCTPEAYIALCKFMGAAPDYFFSTVEFT